MLGVDGYLTGAARRMAVLAGVRQSFAKAEQLLAELSGWELDDDTIRRATHQAARQATTSRPTRGDRPRFAAAAGVLEVSIDAGKVNTTSGWRDVKLAVFAKRVAGAAATPAAWAERALPAPSVRTVVAAIEEAAAFGQRVRAEADRLQVTTAADVTVLGDGAEWVWNLAAAVLPQAQGVLDVYHALEHIAATTQAALGRGHAGGGRPAGRGPDGVADRRQGRRGALDRRGLRGRRPRHRHGTAAGIGCLLQQASDALGVRGTVGAGAQHRQRFGGRQCQAVGQLAAEADGSALATGPCRSARRNDCPGRFT